MEAGEVENYHHAHCQTVEYVGHPLYLQHLIIREGEEEEHHL